MRDYMDLRQLKYFLTIAEEGQITSAARKLQMAQPPLSQQLKQLEEELGVQLVQRGPRSIRLTDAGVMLRDRARQILELADRTARELGEHVKGMTGTLSIGTVSSSGSALFQDRLSEFHRAYEGVKFDIHEGNTFKILDLLNRGIVEIGIIRTPFHAASLECRYAESEPMIAVMTRELAFAESRSSIEFGELKDRPLIIYRRFEQLITDACLENGFEPDIFCMNDDARTTLTWAGSGLGIGIVPRSAFGLVSRDNLLYKEINSDSLRTRIAAVRMKGRYSSALADHFFERFGE